MIDVERISAEKTRQKIISGEGILVCAYKDDTRFNSMHIEGAVSFAQFKSELPSLAKERERERASSTAPDPPKTVPQVFSTGSPGSG